MPVRASLSGASQDSITSVSEVNVTRDVRSSTRLNIDAEHARPNQNIQSSSENSEGLDNPTHSSAPSPTKQLHIHDAIIESVATGGFGTFMDNVSEQNTNNDAVPPGTGSLVIGSHIESWAGRHFVVTHSRICRNALGRPECSSRSLGHMPELDKLWGWLGLDFASPNPFEPLASLPLRESVRDKLAAISQALLQKALRVHQLDPATAAASYPSPSPDGNSRGFLILPPSATMEHFLREYMRIFEPFYLLVPGGVLDANMLLNGSNDTSSTLLILLMIGQGAISDPTNEARRLSGGLTEVCRKGCFCLPPTVIAALCPGIYYSSCMEWR